MLHRKKRVLLAAALALLVAAILYWGCDRLEGDVNSNQLPEVFFVNVPLDSTVFNYAPVVRWTGHDPDGLVAYFQYHDDSTQAAVDSYAADRIRPGALQAYINRLSPSEWVSTYQTQDTIYLRRTEQDSITQHIFMVRCVDNEDGISQVKVRTYFRTNQPPYAPSVKWALDVSLDPPLEYRYVYSIPDTLFWGAEPTVTYPGIGFLWQGSDPDSRELNIIPLTFSWLLMNETTGDTMPHFIFDDSSRIVGISHGWSPWSSATQITFCALDFLFINPYLELDGRYTFHLRVRDDGLTESDSVATATFTAVSAVEHTYAGIPSDFERQLLIVDWNKTPTSADMRFGLRNDQDILHFYQAVIPEGFQVAEQLRQAFYSDPHGPGYIPPIPFDTAWFADKDLNQLRRVPADLIRHFKWVWVINDNPPVNPPPYEAMRARIKLLEDYLDVGGQVMLSGRRVFSGDFNMSQCGPLVPTTQNFGDTYFSEYAHLSTICAKTRHSLSSPEPDFGGANTTDPFLPNLVIDTSVVESLNYGGRHYPCLAEIDYFGRTGAGSGYDYALTMYNYSSCTANATYERTNVDCQILESDTVSAAWARLLPYPGDTRILAVSRIYNVTRNVYGEFMYIDRDPPQTGLWRITVSTPSSAGYWQDSDSLQVDYTYIPIDPAHDQPVASAFLRIQGQLVIDYNTGTYHFGGAIRYRTSLMVFPLSFMYNDTLLDIPYMPGLQASPASMVVAYEALFFNGSRTIELGTDYKRKFLPGG